MASCRGWSTRSWREARTNPGLINVDSDLKLNKPELKVSLDRDKAADSGLEIDTIGRTLETLLGGRQVTRFKQNGKQYDVIVQVGGVDRTNPDDIARIYVRGKKGDMISLANLLKIEETGVTERTEPLQQAALRHHHRDARGRTTRWARG